MNRIYGIIIGFLFQNIDKKLLINPKHFFAPRRQGAKKKTNLFSILKPLRLGVFARESGCPPMASFSG
jgi:hypothetical protein